MEAGRMKDATVLTPNEVHWIERALGERDKLARQVLELGRGRITVCGETGDGRESCGRPATHFTVESRTGTMFRYCLKHWREADPRNVTGLYGAEDEEQAGQGPPAPAAAAGPAAV